MVVVDTGIRLDPRSNLGSAPGVLHVAPHEICSSRVLRPTLSPVSS